MRFLGTSVLFLLLVAVPAARAADWLVDATGQRSPLVNVTQAMALAAPGDRILVLPGTYPAFLFERGVAVIGLGQTVADVQIARVDYHVSIPNQGYDTLLSNVSLGDGAPGNALAFTGNEAAPGVLVVDGVAVHGGMFLGGGANGFHLHMQDSSVTPAPGQGFLGAAVQLGGTAGFSFEIVNSVITGWDASPASGEPAAIGLRIAGGVSGRVVNSIVSGGSGAGSQPAGADAIATFGPPASPLLRLDGESLITGGNGAGAAGGDGVALTGAIELGSATVHGGGGVPAGQAFNGSNPAPMSVDAYLALEPELFGAEGTIAVSSGEVVSFGVEAPASSTALVFAAELNLPSSKALIPIGPPLFIALGNSVSLPVPFVDGLPIFGLQIFAQGFVRPTSGKLVPTNTVTVRLDLLAQP